MLKTVSTSGGGGGGGNISSVTATTPLASSGGSTPDISLSGQVSVANGGTGKANLTLNNVILGNNTGAVLFVAPGTAGNVLTSNGTTWTSNAAAGGGGSGTVTTVSVVSANGLAGTVANPTTTPAITLSTSVTGLLKGNGTAISAASSGTDYSAGTSALATGILKSTTTTGSLSIAVAADFPTLNQNTTGTAAGLSSTLAIGSGGTGQTTASAAFNALSPVTTTGDLIIGNGTNSATRLAIGANTYVLTSNGTTASWTAPSSFTFPTAGIVYSTGSAWATSYTTSGTGTVVALATGATLSSPVISTIVNTGTLTLPTSTDTLVGRATTDTLTNKTLTNPTVTNYTETLYTANTSTAITVDLANGTVQKLTLTGNATITMPTASAGKSFVIILAQDATGSRTVTWSTVVWPSGTAPTITSTASKKDIYSFFADGTSWYGTTIGQNYT
jgi:hypothetical protein